MKLDIPDDQINFILEVLQNQPLPYVRVAPVLGNIFQQINAAQKAAMQPMMTPLPEVPAGA